MIELLFAQAATVVPSEGGLPWPLAAAAFVALTGAIGVQYWENRKKDSTIQDLIKEGAARDLAAREKDLAARAEGTKAIQEVANGMRDVISVIRENGSRITALSTVQETNTRSLIDAVAKRTISSTNTPAVRAEGATKT